MITARERGSAIVEFVFIGLVVLLPLIYLIAAVAAVQRARLAVSNSARDVGRAIASSGSQSDPGARAHAALAIALRSEHFTPADVQLRIVGVGDDCSATPVTPDLAPGSEFTVCVVRRQRLPGVPSVLSGRAITVTGRFTVHLDDYRRTGR